MDAWAVDASGGSPSYSGQELRLSTVTPFMAGAGASLGVRSGIRPSGSGTDLLVQAQSAPNMTVKVNPGVIIVQGAISATQGAYTWVLDTLTNLNIAAAHATLARTDLIAVRIRDASIDTSGQRDGQVIAITGTAGGGVPSLPTDASYITIAQIAVRSVSAGGGTIVAGDITDKRQYTAAPGGVILCDATTEPAAAAVPASQIAYRSDLGVFRGPSGSSWRMITPYRQIQTVTTATQATITFSGIPTFLREVRISGISRGDVAAVNIDYGFRVNNDSGIQYRHAFIYEQNGAAPSSVHNLNATSGRAGAIPGASAQANLFGATELVFHGWASTTGWLTCRSSGGYVDSGGDVVTVNVSHYAPVGPYNRVDLVIPGGNFVQGSEFLLSGWD